MDHDRATDLLHWAHTSTTDRLSLAAQSTMPCDKKPTCTHTHTYIGTQQSEWHRSIRGGAARQGLQKTRDKTGPSMKATESSPPWATARKLRVSWETPRALIECPASDVHHSVRYGTRSAESLPTGKMKIPQHTTHQCLGLQVAHHNDLAVQHLVQAVERAQTGGDLPRDTLPHVNLLAEQLVRLGVVPHLDDAAHTQVQTACRWGAAGNHTTYGRSRAQHNTKQHNTKHM
jgi:hypothetical protein